MRQSTKHVTLLAAIAAAGLATSAVSYTVAIRADDARIQTDLALRADWRANDMTAKLSSPAASTKAIATAFGLATDPEILFYNQKLIEEFRSIGPVRIYLWAPRVAAEERELFERRLRALPPHDFAILDADAAGRPSVAPARAEYFPTVRTWFSQGMQPLIGLDNLIDPVRAEASMRALDNGAVSLSEVTVGVISRQPLLFFVSPVFRGGVVPATIEERRAALRGFVYGTPVAYDLLATSIEGTVKPVSNIHIFSKPMGPDDGSLVPLAQYTAATGKFEHSGTPVDVASLAGFVVKRSLKVVDREWTAFFQFPPGFVAAMRTPSLWMWWVGTLCITGLVMLIVHREQQQLARAERAVSRATHDLTQRSDELSAAHDALHQLNVKLEQRVLDRTAQLEAKNENLKEFVYTVSHDLKAPLRGISGYAQELDRRHRAGLDERAQFCIAQIGTAAKNLDRLIEDLLKYASLDVEVPTPADVDLPDLVHGILADHSHSLNERGFDVETDIPAIVLRVWERGLKQALGNLIDNAIKYSSHAARPRVTVSAKTANGRCQIYVADNGIGFDMKYRDRIFGLFNRLVRADEFEGTGAGLAIVKKVVEKLGGSIRAESAPGQGATFIVDLPLHAQPRVPA